MYIAIQANGLRQDNTTESKARSIATQLNSYTDQNGQVPDDLRQAGITDEPSAISYQKKSNGIYQFCATYKAASSSEPKYSVIDDLARKTVGDNYGQYGGYDSSYMGDQYSLVIGAHKKGKNCQTIKTYSSNYLDNQSTTKNECTYDFSKSYSENTAYNACIDKQNNTQFN